MVFVRQTIWRFASADGRPSGLPEREALYLAAKNFLASHGYALAADDPQHQTFRAVSETVSPGLRCTAMARALPDPTGGSSVRFDLRVEESRGSAGEMGPGPGQPAPPRAQDLRERREELRASIHRVQEDGANEWARIEGALRLELENLTAHSPATQKVGPAPPPASPPPAVDLSRFVSRMNVEFGPLQVIEEGKLSHACTLPWFNQTLCEVNDTWVRMGVCQGEYVWHQHDDTDEFFYIIEGKWLIDLEGRTVELGPRQGFVVPKGVRHRPRAPVRTVLLMAEKRGVIPTGSATPSGPAPATGPGPVTPASAGSGG